MLYIHYETITGNELTEPILNDAAKLFSEHYGTWGEHSHNPGKRIKLKPRALQAALLPSSPSDPSSSSTTYTKATVNNILAGHVFATRWKHIPTNANICWITQLVVHSEYRERGIATGLLNAVKRDHERDDDNDNGCGDGGDDVYGILSSHPASCMTAAKCFGTGIEGVDLEFIRDVAREIMKSSSVAYVRGAVLRGRLFDTGDETGLVCGADTGFFVDHAVPNRVLRGVKENRGRDWPLGELPEGCEFLVVLPARRHSQGCG